MELELGLGLALPNHSPMMIQGLDLNCNNSNGLATENHEGYSSQKRMLFLDQDRSVGIESTNLSLFLWGDVRRQPEEEGGGGRQPKWRKIHVDDDDDDCQEIEGWPPVNSSWKEPPRCRHGGSAAAAERLRKSMHVKVKMEGVAIGRKVDLGHYDSYQALTNTLIHMFAKYSKIDTNMEEYTLSYQDKEGDWMLVGDVQWEMFVESVQRVEIIKNDNKMGFRLLSRKS
ncbi:hypothetical protein C2S51_018345 [Perilla frutescens var. frutescens]|nr:hypothetical protein C2S51_018345 [Perilla frutescens var. frutescens]